MIEKISDSEILLKVNNQLYASEAVLQTSYKFIDQCYIHMDMISKDIMGIHFKIKNGDFASLENVVNEFCNELIDQQVRFIVDRNYSAIRNEIVKKAFSPID